MSGEEYPAFFDYRAYRFVKKTEQQFLVVAFLPVESIFAQDVGNAIPVFVNACANDEIGLAAEVPLPVLPEFRNTCIQFLFYQRRVLAQQEFFVERLPNRAVEIVSKALRRTPRCDM